MDSLFGFDKVSPHDDCSELLTTVHDSVELSIVRSLLDEEKIPYLIKERGSGSSVRIIAGYSMFGTDIFVPSAAAESAKALLEAYRNAEEIPDDENAEETPDGEV